MGKATDKDLGELHGAVTRLLTDVVENGVTVGLDEDGKAVKATAPAAYVVAALAMLKNNNITADASTNAELSGLAKKLAEKRAAGKHTLSPAALGEAAEQLERDLPGFMQ